MSTGYIIFATLSVRFGDFGGSSIWIQGLAPETLELVDPILCSAGDRYDNHQGYKDEVGPVVNHGKR